jgi:hypothetical protein
LTSGTAAKRATPDTLAFNICRRVIMVQIPFFCRTIHLGG